MKTKIKFFSLRIGLILSLVLHTVLLSLLFFSCNIINKSTDNQIFIQGKKNTFISATLNFATPNPKNLKITFKKNNPAIQSSENSSTIKTIKTIKAINGNRKNLLNTLIYTDISEHEIYPKNAQRLHQTGAVTIFFDLTPSGKIINLAILHSSGYEILDQAAIAAILNAQPFLGIQKYLNTVQSFRLKLKFQN